MGYRLRLLLATTIVLAGTLGGGTAHAQTEEWQAGGGWFIGHLTTTELWGPGVRPLTSASWTLTSDTLDEGVSVNPPTEWKHINNVAAGGVLTGATCESGFGETAFTFFGSPTFVGSATLSGTTLVLSALGSSAGPGTATAVMQVVPLPSEVGAVPCVTEPARIWQIEGTVTGAVVR